MNLKTCSMVAALLLAACNGGHVSAQSGQSVETRPGNGADFQPAFPSQTRAPEIKSNVAFDAVTVVSGLTNPFGFAFLPDGRILITERAGNLRIATPDGRLSAPASGLPPVAAQGQGGLLDIVLDPKFSENRLVYWSFSEAQADGGNNTAVARGRLVDGDPPRLEDVKVIYHQSPSLNSRLHFGSRLVFARDGTLFVGQGERSIMAGRVQAQDLKSLLGKIVRINTDGSIPADNPFTARADARPEIWSYGHRNVQGMALHPVTGELWSLEHGPQGGDEINISRKGLDYGWPSISYGVEYGPGARRVGEGKTQTPGMEQPVYYWDPVIAPGALTFYTGGLFPSWKGSLFASGLDSNYFARLTLDGDKVVGEERFQLSTRERYRDISEGPDGALYLLTDRNEARLVKLVPKR